MLDPLVYEARRNRLVFVALLLGLGLVAFVVQGGGATGAEPAAARRVRSTAEPHASAGSRPHRRPVTAELEAPATLLVSNEVGPTTTVPPTTAPPTTAPRARLLAARVTTPTTAPPTTAPRPANVQSGTATWYEGGS